MENRYRLAASLAGILMAATAHANRPLNTDTADTIAAQRCQFEPYAGRARSSGAPSESFWLLQLNCGISGNTQLGASWLSARSQGESDHVVALGGKTHFVELKGGQTGLALGYAISAARPAGDSWSGEGVSLNGIASREFADGWLGHANLGWSHSRSAHASSTTWGLATEYSFGNGLVGSAELYGDDRARPWLGVGALWQLSERTSVNVSYGSQRSSPRVRQTTIGFLIEF